MLRVDAEPIMAAVPDDPVSSGDLALQNAIDEPVGVGLAADGLWTNAVRVFRLSLICFLFGNATC